MEGSALYISHPHHHYKAELSSSFSLLLLPLPWKWSHVHLVHTKIRKSSSGSARRRDFISSARVPNSIKSSASTRLHLDRSCSVHTPSLLSRSYPRQLAPTVVHGVYRSMLRTVCIHSYAYFIFAFDAYLLFQEQRFLGRFDFIPEDEQSSRMATVLLLGADRFNIFGEPEFMECIEVGLHLVIVKNGSPPQTH